MRAVETGIAVTLGILLILGAKSMLNTQDLAPDFLSFYGAGTLIRENPEKLYDVNAQLEIQRRTGIPTDADRLLVFAYPAIVAILITPLTFFEFETARLIMLIINGLMSWAALLALFRFFDLSTSQHRLLLIGTALSLPFWAVIGQGQLDVLVLNTFILMLTQQRIGFWSAFLLIKPTIGIFIWPWILIRRRRAIPEAVVTGILLFIGPVLLIGPDAMIDYFALNQTMMLGDVTSAHTFNQFTLRAVAPLWIWISIFVISLIAFKRFGNRFSPTEELMAAITVGLMLAPHVHGHTLILLFIPLAFILKRWTIGPIGITGLIFGQWIFGLPVLPVTAGMLVILLANKKVRHDELLCVE